METLSTNTQHIHRIFSKSDCVGKRAGVFKIGNNLKELNNGNFYTLTPK